MTPELPLHLRMASPPGRITAKQAAERLEAGMFCKECHRSDLKLIKTGVKTYRCQRDFRKAKKTRSEAGKAKRQQTIYGITLEEAKQIEAEQDGGCICAPWTNYDGSGKRSLSTDHDHKTGEVRGRLCKHCNDLLGRVMDDPAYFRNMVAYLENPPARRVVGRRVVPGHGQGAE